MSRRYEVCIIGGGAAGLAAAVSIRRRIRTCILEKNPIPGRKLLATGGGRCNLTNAACAGARKTLDFFASMGLESRLEEEGRYYPYSGRAADVVKVLTDGVKEAGHDIIPDCEAVSIRKTGDGFLILAERKSTARGKKAAETLSITADRVLLACGGKAGPQYGTTGDGYRLASSLGHRISRVYPILTAIECGDMKDLKGIRARGTVTLNKDGAPVASESGEIQFTEDGISGICVFNLTPMIRAEEGESLRDALARFEVSLDLAPDLSPERLSGRETSFGILTEALAARVKPEEIRNWRLPVRGIKGWRQAQCTGGGIPLDEVDPVTMESVCCPGLYLAGEILDRQGPCGGFNLQNAWETGIAAAEAINAAAGKDARPDERREENR